MKLATFAHNDSTRIGVVDGDDVLDVTAADATIPAEMIAFLTAGDEALEKADAASGGAPRLALADVCLKAPVTKPGKYLALGLNYQNHIEETGMQSPKFPTFFNKQTTCVTGPYDPIHLPRASKALDYEGELAFVIGKRCRHVPKDEAAMVIAGYCIANDVSIRDWQVKAPTMTLGKSWDTHGPLGPWIVTPDDVGDPHALELRTMVNNEERQHSNTKHFIYSCFDMVETLSTVCTLEPGDVMTTGTPAGVGARMRPQRFMKAGDVVRVEIEKLGYIENPVIDEPDSTVLY